MPYKTVYKAIGWALVLTFWVLPPVARAQSAAYEKCLDACDLKYEDCLDEAYQDKNVDLDAADAKCTASYHQCSDGCQKKHQKEADQDEALEDDLPPLPEPPPTSEDPEK